MNDLPPGVLYLLQRSPKILSPLALTYAIAHFVGTKISTWWIVLAMVTSLPLALMLSILYDEISIRVDASKRGAVLPPRVSDPYPGGAKALISGLKQLKTGYPGDGFEELCEKLGSYTFNRRILFENRVCCSFSYHVVVVFYLVVSDYYCRTGTYQGDTRDSIRRFRERTRDEVPFLPVARNWRICG
jgi:hypothetical protein